MAIREIQQNPERYTQKGSDWQIQAAPQIVPIVLKSGSTIQVKPLIKATGIVVKVDTHYLISPETLKDIQDSKNPHFDIISTGEIRVKDSVVNTGKTVPIIEVKTEGLLQKIGEQDKLVPFAGVSGVDFITETELVDGVPKGLIQQIDYTLTGEGQRPADRFLLSDLNLDGDYSIDQLKIDTAQEDGTLDQKKLETFLTEINNRLRVLRGDFNNIKRIHYLGEQPSGSTLTTTEYIQVATSEESGSNEDEQVVFKESRMIDMGSSIQTGGGTSSPTGSVSTPSTTGTPDSPAQTVKGEWILKKKAGYELTIEDPFEPVFKSSDLKAFPRNRRYREQLVKTIKLDETFVGKKIGPSQFRSARKGNSLTTIWEVYDTINTEKVIGYLYVSDNAFSIEAKK